MHPYIENSILSIFQVEIQKNLIKQLQVSFILMKSGEIK